MGTFAINGRLNPIADNTGMLGELDWRIMAGGLAAGVLVAGLIVLWFRH
jgi:hypothetical protein